MLFFHKNLFIKYLTNHTILRFEADNEGVGMILDGNLSFGIDNKYKILGSKEFDYTDLIGCKVLKIKQTKDLFTMILTNNITIEVGLKDDDYSGPEAMQLVLPNGQSIIERGDE